ncbi:hypothetical protein ACVWVY_002732 [Bradyrhizobium sp. URHC0002]|jgi:hypothetical protein
MKQTLLPDGLVVIVTMLAIIAMFIFAVLLTDNL